MPANSVEQFDAWVKTGSAGRVLVVQIDRGDRSAANRLTFTTRGYYDPGVDGVRYHDTYPAPVPCILSKIVTDESLTSTSFEEIVISNDGRFDGLLAGPNMLGHRVTVLFGDVSWSLMSTTYPERFLVAFVAEVEGVRFISRGRIGIKIRPVTYKLDNILGGVDAPLGLGKCRNVPCTLVNAGLNRYRCNTVRTDDNYWGPGTKRWFVRDNGAELAGPYEAMPKFTAVLESGIFKGLFDLTGGSPVGRLTADINYAPNDPSFRNYYSMASQLIRSLLVEHLVSDYPQLVDNYYLGHVNSRAIALGMNDTRLYYLSSDEIVRQFNFGTAGTLTTISTTAKSLDVSAELATVNGVQISADGLTMWASDENKISQYTLTVAGELDSGSYSGNSFTIATIDPALELRAWYVAPGGLFYFVDSDTRTLHRLTFTGNNISTLSTLEVLFAIPTYTTDTFDWLYSMEVSPDGMRAYFTWYRALMVVQYDAVAPWDFKGSMPSRRSFYDGRTRYVGVADPCCFRMGKDGDRFFILDVDEEVFQFDGIQDYDLPVNVLTTNITGEQAVYNVGVFYPAETRIGQVLSDLLLSWTAGYTISKDGSITAIKLKNPDYVMAAYETLHPIYLGDCIGETDHVMHVSSEPAAYKVTIRYGKNFTVQNESELAGVVTDSNKALFAKEWLTVSTTTSLPEYIDPGEIILDTYLTENDEAQETRDDVVSLRSVARYNFAVKCKLHTFSLLGDFGLGSIVELNLDFPAFESGDRALVKRRQIHWTDEYQVLEVFK